MYIIQDKLQNISHLLYYLRKNLVVNRRPSAITLCPLLFNLWEYLERS